MVPFKLSAIAERFADFKLQGDDFRAENVSTDSRRIEQGALYVPIRGERFDGHDFIIDAVKKGAGAVVCSPDRWDLIKLSLPHEFPVLLCPDTLRGLGYLGQYVRESIQNLKVVSLTGSCGKTTVKEFTAAILQRCGRTMCTRGNFNNDVGVPLTLLSLTSDLDYAVIEQGASHPDDIRRSCRFIKSDAALITNVGGAHLEGFGSELGIYRGKSEILEDVFLRNGTGIVPSDSVFAQNWREDFKTEFKAGRLKFFGTNEGDFVRVSDIKTCDNKVALTLTALGQSAFLKLNMIGEHNALNAAAAAALALCAGADFQDVVSGLESCDAVKGRLDVKKLSFGTLIDDSYNASFGSVISALNTLKLQEGARLFCFGDMGELGSSAGKLHDMVAKKARDCADMSLVMGPFGSASFRNEKSAQCFENHDDLIAALTPLLTQGPCCVLVKGSHAMNMSRIAQYLREHYPC